jgi:hypothetical protein
MPPRKSWPAAAIAATSSANNIVMRSPPDRSPEGFALRFQGAVRSAKAEPSVVARRPSYRDRFCRRRLA